MEIFIWIVIILLFILSFIGVVVPILPSVAFLWVGFLLYYFFLNQEAFTLYFWISMLVLTLVLIVADLLTNRYFVHRFGGNKRSEWGAIVGVIIGSFIYPPIGMIILPLLLVFLLEILAKRPVKMALYASLGAFIGFLSGIAAKIIIQAVMVIIFFIVI